MRAYWRMSGTQYAGITHVNNKVCMALEQAGEDRLGHYMQTTFIRHFYPNYYSKCNKPYRYNSEQQGTCT